MIGAQLTDHKYLYESLISMGLEFNKDFVVMGIGGYTELLNRIDPLLGLNRVNDIILGFKIYGNKNIKNKKIVILGNSTSDATTNAYESWPEKLFKKADKDMSDITLYNGAITGYSTTQELLKFQRDVLPLEPDICISFSGYNDVCGNSTLEKYPFVHKYQNKFFDFLKK